MTIMKTAGRLASAVTLAVCAGISTQSRADISDHFTFSGFGTFGGVVTDTDDVHFGRDRQLGGATRSADFQVDSNLGFQVTARANDWLSFTAQALAAKRDENYSKLEVEWAFVKVQPVSGLALRAGHMPLPTFVVSDSRNVGYANTWLRAPNEVYGLALLRGMDGADLTYSKKLGDVGLTATILAGDSTVRALGSDYDANKVRGANLQVQYGPVALRAGKLQSDNYVSAQFPDERYTFTGYGVTIDHGKFIGQAEYVQRRGEYYYNLVAANGWYAMAGYRLGKVTPYAIYSKTKPHFSDSHVPLQNSVPLISNEQKTVALGLRWDATDFAAIKFQYENANTNDSPGISFSSPDAPAPALWFATPVTGSVNVFSATIDFVF
jgi:hypothetical protein